jgi:hypothetical protein
MELRGSYKRQWIYEFKESGDQSEISERFLRQMSLRTKSNVRAVIRNYNCEEVQINLIIKSITCYHSSHRPCIRNNTGVA